MNYSMSTKFVNYNEYEYIVSIGNKSPTAMILKKLNIYKESFPFDYIPTTPHLILKYMQNQDEFYPKKNEVITADGVSFAYFNIDSEYTETIEAFKQSFQRLFDILQNKKKILFVYTAEADIYNEMNNRYNDNYNQLSKLVEYIIETYKYDTFKLVCIHTNKSFADTNNIINYTMNVPFNFFSDDMSTRTENTSLQYRNLLEALLKDVFRI